MLPRTPVTPSPAPRLPLDIPSSVSSTVTLNNDEESAPSKTAQDKLDDVFHVHDVLISNNFQDIDLPVTNIVSVGLQSCGKSTVLSVISGIPLWSASKTATIAPTQIHSRYRPDSSFKAHIEIGFSNSLPDARKKIVFTIQPITNKTHLAAAMRLAGYEARRMGETGSSIINYEEFMAMPAQERLAYLEQQASIKGGWTANTIILHVSGPAQANISILDMPGLMGGANGAITYDLVKAEIGKPHNLILLCVAAGAADPSCDSPEVKVVRACDPTGSRTMGLITKADKIEDPSDFIDLLTNNDPNWSFRPKHGWWAVSPKTYDENRDGASELAVRARQAALFAEERWQAVQKRCGVRFGTEGVKASLYRVFEQTVIRNVDKLKKVLEDQNTTTVDALTLLPPEISEPVGALHDLIHAFSTRIRSLIVEEHTYTSSLVRLQTQLNIDLAATLPYFIPVFEKDQDKSETYAPPVIQGWDGEGSTQVIYLDEVLQLVRKYTSCRDQTCNINRVRQHFIQKCASQWNKTCQDHIRKVWQIIDQAIEEVSAGTREEREDLRSRIRDALKAKSGIFKSNASDFAVNLCKRELQDPSLIDIADPTALHEYKNAFEHMDAFFSSTYNVHPLGPAGLPRSPVSCPPGNSQLPCDFDMDESQRRNSFIVMAKTSLWLVRGLMRVSNVVGREAQAQAHDFLDEVASTLRKGFRLEEVAPSVCELSKTLLEPDAEVVEKRRGLKRRLAELDDISARLKRVHQDS